MRLSILGVRQRRDRFEHIEKLANQGKITEQDTIRKLKALTLCRIGSLTKHQQKLCTKFPLEVMAAFRGFHEAVNECRHQFRNERWNCSSLVNMGTNVQPLLTPIMRRGFKEVAFVHALVAAAVAKSVTVDCARGLITSCDRLLSLRQQSKAGSLHVKGYDAFIQYGLRFSVKFLNSREDGNDFQGVVNKHNLKTGRLTLINNLKALCKCHGVSGSCSLKSCVNTMPGLRHIATVLKELYKKARKIVAVNEKRHGTAIVRALNGENPPSTHDLIYMENSPTFCDRGDSLGITGVIGRICSRNTTQDNSCEVLCCGRGYNTKRLQAETQCRCVFKWCCSVQCKTCSSEKWITSCK